VSVHGIPDPTCNNIGVVATQRPGGGTAARQGSTVIIGVGVRPKNPCP
jgi:hypothetical protein